MNNMVKNKKSIYQILIMIFITILIQACTLIKTSQLASIFGINMEMDAYNFANNIASFVLGFVATGVTTVLIPAYVMKLNKTSINTFLTTIYGSVILITALILLVRRPLIMTLTNRDNQFIDITLILLPILMIYNFITATLSITTAFFQCQNRFYIEKILLLITNLIIVVLLFLIPNIDIIKYTITISLLSLTNLIMQFIIAYKSGFNFYPELKFHDTNFRKLLKIFIPTIFSSGLYKLSLLIDSIIATNLKAGDLSILNYSTQLMNMINTLLVSNVLVYIYPKIVGQIDKDNFQDKFFDICIAFFSLMCIVVACFILAGKNILILFFERGKFTSNITILLFYCSYIYILGQPIDIVRELIYRYFYAKGDTKNTLKNSVLVSIFNIVISVILSYMIGVYGIILGTTISSTLSLSMILKKFRGEFGFKFNKKKVLFNIIKSILATIITVISGIIINNIVVINNIFVNILFNSSYGILVFSLCLLLLKSNILICKEKEKNQKIGEKIV